MEYPPLPSRYRYMKTKFPAFKERPKSSTITPP